MAAVRDVDPSDPWEFLRDVRQGHVFVLPEASAGSGGLHSGARQVVVISQTCDVVLGKQPTIIVASVITLQGDRARQATRREMPRYIRLPMLGKDQFADLAWVRAVQRTEFGGLQYSQGIDVTDDEAVRAFALAVGRWFSRFAFPDDVVPWLNPLIELVRAKYNKPASPLGRVLAEVVEFRVESENWATRPLDLSLHVIVKAGSIPTLEADDLDEGSLASDSNENRLRTPSEIAQLLIEADTPAALATLWPLFAESLALHCVPKAHRLTQPEQKAAVRVVAQLWEDDQFPLSRYRKSEMLDIDYLSEPHPL